MEQYVDYNDRLAVPDKLFTPLHGVELTGGLFRQVFANNIEFTLKCLNMDRMRYWFDVKQGNEPKAKRYSGHFEDNLKGQTASQFLMSAGNTLRWVEHAELRAGMNQVLDFIEAAAEKDGFLMPIDQTQFAFREYPHYVRIWLNYGLIAAGLGGSDRALPLLRRWQDWFNRCPDLPVIKYLELAFQGVVASTSVYFTPVGQPEDMAVNRQYYEETWRLAQFIGHERDAVHIRRQHGAEPHAHGSELEGFEGYLDMYRFFGAPYLLNAVKGCWDLYVQDWQHVGGGIVMCEMSPHAQPGCRYFYTTNIYNELCTSAFWLQLNQRLHRLFPDEERYVFEMEQSIYNIAIANQRDTTDIRSYAWIDLMKKRPIRPNHCCSGVGTRIFASLPEYLFTMNRDTLSCDLFAACRLHWQTAGQIIDVEEETLFPYDGQVDYRFNMAKPQYFTLRVRVPRYAGQTDIFLNGGRIAVGKPGTYAVIQREWQNGDHLSFTLAMTFEAHLYDGVDQVKGFTRYALTYGPLLMALVGDRNHTYGTILENCQGPEFIRRLEPTATPLHFRYRGTADYDVVPYFEICDEYFTCYPMFRDNELLGYTPG